MSSNQGTLKNKLILETSLKRESALKIFVDHTLSLTHKSKKSPTKLLANINKPRFLAKRLSPTSQLDKKKEVKGLAEIKEDVPEKVIVDKNFPSLKQTTSSAVKPQPNFSTPKPQNSSIFSEEALAIANENAEFSVLNSGPRFNNKGEIIKYSIVGKPENFLKQLTSDQKNLNHFFVGSPGATPKINPFSHTTGGQAPKPRSTFNFQDSNEMPSSSNNHSLLNNTSLRNSNEDFCEEKNSILPSLPLGVSNTAASINKSGGLDAWTTIAKFNKQIKRRFKKHDLTKKDLLNEIEKAEDRERKILEDDSKTVSQMPYSDQLYFTKESRIIRAFEEKEKFWERKIRQFGKISF